MKKFPWIPAATFISCGLTCIAFEAMRVYGWYNRWGPFNEQDSFADIAFGGWSIGMLIMYLIIFIPYFVVLCNANNPKIRLGWFVLSLVILVAAAINAPDSVDGRWGNTTETNFALFYQFIVPLPALVCIGYGLWPKFRPQRNENL